MAKKGQRGRMCSGKVRHKDKAAAIIALKRINNHGLSGYFCRYCKGWHLGNNPKKIQLRLDQLLDPSVPYPQRLSRAAPQEGEKPT